MGLLVQNIGKKAVGYVLLFVLAVVLMMSIAATPAQAAFSLSSDTLGVGRNQSVAPLSNKVITPQSKFAITSADVVASSGLLAVPVERRVMNAQVAQIVENTNRYGTEDHVSFSGTDVYVSAAGITINVSGNWDTAIASTYGFGDEAGQGTAMTGFGPVTEHTMGIALPIELARSIVPYGTQFELSYNGNSCIVTMCDCGGFAKYGRTFDLQPAVASILGVSGLGNVSYRFLGYPDEQSS